MCIHIYICKYAYIYIYFVQAGKPSHQAPLNTKNGKEPSCGTLWLWIKIPMPLLHVIISVNLSQVKTDFGVQNKS